MHPEVELALRNLRIPAFVVAFFVGTCCLSPGIAFRLHHGRPPLVMGQYTDQLVAPGMSADEVRAALGEPHQIEPCPRNDHRDE